jgi:hypothetical protein
MLRPGKAVTRSIWGESRFAFDGLHGEVITLQVTGKAPGLDPRVSLIDPEDNKEASDDDSGGHGNSLIKRHVLRQSGQYTVEVELAGGDGGEVTILLKKTKVANKKRRQT